MLADEVSDNDPYEGTHTDSDEDYVPDNEKPNPKRKLFSQIFSDDSHESLSNDSHKSLLNDSPSTSSPRNMPDIPVEDQEADHLVSSNNTQHQGKKRLTRKALWKRNIQKTKRVKGEPYKNIAGVHKIGKHIGNNCNCKLKCFDEIGPEGCSKIFRDFYAMESKELQDSYLYGLIQREKIHRSRPRSGEGNKKYGTFVYKIRLNGIERKICKIAFLSLHGITRARLERLQKHQNMGHGTPPADRRGRHALRPNKLPEGTDDKIREHILSYPRYKSHYSRKDNLHHYYLAPLLSIAKMHKMYLERYEPAQYQLLLQRQNIEPIVKYEYYRKFFTENFRISFGKPKSDTCQKCDKLMNQIAASDTDEQKRKLETEKKLHVTKADTFYDDIKSKTTLAKNDPSVEVLSFDFQQNLPLPVCPSGDVFYKIQLWVYNFCINVGSTGKSFFYLYDETLAAKGQNDVASMLLHFLNNHIDKEVTDVYIFSDNCSSQNKNYVLIQFFYTLMETSGKFRLIQHRYPEPGHSFLPCDRSFGAIEMEKRKHERIYLPQEYADIIENTRKDFQVINATQDMFLNFKDHLQKFFVKNPSRKNNKFTISKYRIIQYEKVGTEISFKCSESVSLHMFTAFDIRDKRTLQALTLPNAGNLLYDGRRKLKKNKFDHVMSLAKNYVPPCDQWFYNDIEKYHRSFLSDNEETPASEFSDQN